MSTDLAADFRAFVDAETGEGPYVSRLIANQVVAKLRATDPDLLTGWLDQQAEQIVWQFINDRDRSIRSHARVQSKPRLFATDAEKAEGGDKASLVKWLDVPFAVADGSRKRLAVMTGEDLIFASTSYEERARRNRMTASFLRAISRKVASGQVKDHYTDGQLSAMWDSLSTT